LDWFALALSLYELPFRVARVPTVRFCETAGDNRSLPTCHGLLTIRNLTGRASALSKAPIMNKITVKRTILRRAPAQQSVTRRSLRELSRCYRASERRFEWVVEALFFVIIVAISAWPILAAAGALQEFFQRAAI
jgi:hypothetical protein